MRTLFVLIACVLSSPALLAQGQLELYKGNKAYLDGDLDQAESLYRESLNEDPSTFAGTFNLGNTYYRKQDVNGAITQYQQAIDREEDPMKKASAYHNIGNTLLQSQKIDEAIEAYKNALRLNPSDDETRYNLAYAQRMKRQQEQQQQQQQQQDQDQQNQDQQDQEKNQDQQKQDDQEKQDKENKQDNSDKQDKDKDGEQDQQQPKEGEEKEEEGKPSKPRKPIELSPREAEQLLEAAKNQDQETLMQLRKQKGTDKNIQKDW